MVGLVGEQAPPSPPSYQSVRGETAKYCQTLPNTAICCQRPPLAHKRPKISAWLQDSAVPCLDAAVSCMLFSRREAPSLKAMVGNAKKRSTLIFDNCIDWQIYKGFTADQAEIEREPPSAVVIGLVLGSLATTDRGRWYARLMYSAENPSCKDVYSRFFDALSITKEGKGDAYPIVDHFYQYCLDLNLRMNPRDELAEHLSRQWHSLTRILTWGGGLDEARGEAKSLGAAVEGVTDGDQPILGYVAFIRSEWPRLHWYTFTYEVLSDLAALGRPTSTAASETPAMRRDLIRRIDDFYGSRDSKGKRDRKPSPRRA